MVTILILLSFLVLIVVIGFLIYASASIKSGFYIKAITSVNTDAKEVSLTFDDGPNPRVTPLILQVLNKYNVKATFFCIGKNIEENPDLFHRIYAEDHLIGNHTYSHSNIIDFFPYKSIKKELIKTHDLIKIHTGRDIRFFRPPYGVTNPPLAKAIKSMQYITIGWSIRTFDTCRKITAKKLAENTIKNIRPGAIILFHDKFERNVLAVEYVIKGLFISGYTIKRLDELINIDGYVDKNDTV